MAQVLNYFKSMLPFMLAVLPVLALVRLLLHLRRKGPINWFHEVGVVAFGMFLVGLLSQAVISFLVQSAAGGWQLVFQPADQWRLNLVPLRVVSDTYQQISQGNWDYLIINVMGNILMFAPIGFFVALLWGKGWKQAALWALAVSLFIELTQLPQGRASDIDDVWLNVLGGLLGYGIYWLVRKMPILKRFQTK